MIWCASQGKTASLLIVIIFVVGCSRGVAYQENLLPPEILFRYSCPSVAFQRALGEEEKVRLPNSGPISDFQLLRVLTKWSHDLWEHDPWGVARNADPLSIVQEAKRGGRFRCVEYAAVLTDAFRSYGLVARRLYLKSRAVETAVEGAGHVAVEAYFPSLKKWVFVDPQWAFVPAKGGVPLSVFELNDELEKGAILENFVIDSETDGTSYLRWIRPYLYYLEIELNEQPQSNAPTRVMLLPKGASAPVRFQEKHLLHRRLFTYSAELLKRVPLRGEFGCDGPNE